MRLNLHRNFGLELKWESHHINMNLRTIDRKKKVEIEPLSRLRIITGRIQIKVLATLPFFLNFRFL